MTEHRGFWVHVLAFLFVLLSSAVIPLLLVVDILCGAVMLWEFLLSRWNLMESVGMVVLLFGAIVFGAVALYFFFDDVFQKAKREVRIWNGDTWTCQCGAVVPCEQDYHLCDVEEKNGVEKMEICVLEEDE